MPPDVTRVEITAGGRGAMCSLDEVLVLCTPATTSVAAVTAYGPSGIGTPVPLP